MFFVVIGRRCRRRRFRCDLSPVTNGQKNVDGSPRISLICNSSTIQPVNSPSCGWCFNADREMCRSLSRCCHVLLVMYICNCLVVDVRSQRWGCYSHEVDSFWWRWVYALRPFRGLWCFYWINNYIKLWNIGMKTILWFNIYYAIPSGFMFQMFF